MQEKILITEDKHAKLNCFRRLKVVSNRNSAALQMCSRTTENEIWRAPETFETIHDGGEITGMERGACSDFKLESDVYAWGVVATSVSFLVVGTQRRFTVIQILCSKREKGRPTLIQPFNNFKGFYSSKDTMVMKITNPSIPPFEEQLLSDSIPDVELRSLLKECWASRRSQWLSRTLRRS